MNIAVCENNVVSAERLCSWIEQYCRLYQVPAVLRCFFSAAEFFAHGERFDIVYYCAGGSTGFCQARQLRERGWQVRCFLLGEAARQTPDSAEMRRRWEAGGGVPYPL